MTALAERPDVGSVPADLAQGVSNLSAWLEGMRSGGSQDSGGYGGPIMHWWESNFLMTGTGFDWRYEGIIDGYRELYLRSNQPEHLRLAVQAAQDLLPQQLPDGRFRRSSFQFGPVAGGTPHEAALDVALLKLAGTLRQQGDAQADRQATAMTQAATHNILGYWTGQLWDGQGFRDQPYKSVYVPNKHATLLEALLEAQFLTGADYSEYVSACVRVILGAQVHDGPQSGGTVHLGIGPSRLAIPIYTARTMNGLLSWYDAQPDAGLRRALEAATRFLLNMIRPGGVAWGVYGSGRLALNPVMIAGAGDVLRFLLRMQERELYSVSEGIGALTGLLLSAQLPSGGLPTAHGFAGKGLSSPTFWTAPDLRDVLPVVGWSDKAFRALVLALPVGVRLPTPRTRPYHVPVSWRGHQGVFQETAAHFVMSGGPYQYRWTKGRPAPDVYAL